MLAALRVHDDPVGDGVCPAMAYRRYVVLLVGADGDVRVGQPYLGLVCSRDAAEAVAAARFSGEVGRVRAEQALDEAEARHAEESSAADTAAQRVGCAGSWKDMASVEVRDARSGPPPLTAPDVWPDAATVRVCLFEVSPALSGPDLPVGLFVRGRELSGAEAGDVRDALVASTAAAGDPGCAGRATRFVVLSPDRGSFVVAHLDGCRLADVDGHGVRVSTTALTGLLEQVSAPV